jgi:hypothetical protein
MLSRRQFNQQAASWIAISAATALVPVWAQRTIVTLDPALDPQQVPEHWIPLLQAAIKAPSGHNSQPWLFEIRPKGIRVLPDWSRRLPVVDPDDRELYISLGCAVENITIAAQEHGYDWEIDLFPANESAIDVLLYPNQRPVAAPLYHAITERQSNRSIFSGESIDAAYLKQLEAMSKAAPKGVGLHVFNDPIMHHQLTDLILAGNITQLNDQAFREELFQWMRFNARHVERTNDGLTYAALGFPSLPGFLASAFVKPSLKGDKQNDRDLPKLKSASAFAVLTIEEDERKSWVTVGRFAQCVKLTNTRAGIAQSYFNQPIEVVNLRSAMISHLGLGKSIPVLLLRMGYSIPTPRSPRRPLSAVIS